MFDFSGSDHNGRLSPSPGSRIRAIEDKGQELSPVRQTKFSENCILNAGGLCLERYLDQLSGGQRKRAFVAMVLAQDTDYVLFDEPLNNLDIKHAVSTMRLFRRMADDLGKTVLLVIHDINFASVYSDRIIAMRDGQVIADGAPADVIVGENLEAVFDIPFEIHDMGGKRILDFYDKTVTSPNGSLLFGRVEKI